MWRTSIVHFYRWTIDTFHVARHYIYAAVILWAGLIIRVHPQHILLSVISWYSFILALVMLYEDWPVSIAELRVSLGAKVMSASLLYNAWFHWYILQHL